jgi:hypothetical protein
MSSAIHSISGKQQLFPQNAAKFSGIFETLHAHIQSQGDGFHGPFDGMP